MALGFSFGKKKGSTTQNTTTDVKETSQTAQTQATTGSTQTNTNQTGSQTGSSTGLSSTDQVNRNNQTTTGNTTTTGTTTTLDQGIQDQLKGALGSLLGNQGNAGAGLMEFDADQFINDSVNAATVRGENQLQETNSTIGNAIGGTASDNTMAALLAQRGSNDLAASLAGVRAQATQTAAGIQQQNVQTASQANAQNAAATGAIGDLLKGATTTSTQQSLEEQIAALVGSQTGNTRTNEQNQQNTSQQSSSSQLVQELIAALSNTNSTKVGTENIKGTTKGSGGGFSLGI